MKKLLYRTLFICMFIVSVILITGCKKKSQYITDEKLGYLAYDEFMDDENLIYIEESDGYHPYIVLTNSYDGKTLLLRKHLLEDFIRMHEYYAQYEDCEMDNYLNNDFFDTLSSDIQEKVQDTNIVVTEQAWDGRNDNGKTYTINRKIFLLSSAELGFTWKYVVQKEGKFLKYFKEKENWFAYLENDNKKGYPWWLRTNDIMTESCFFFVAGDKPITSSINAFDSNGVRPAFCLDSGLEIEKIDQIVVGKEVYILKD